MMGDTTDDLDVGFDSEDMENLIEMENRKEQVMSKFTLENTSKGGKKLPPRIVAYGTDGIGKSTFASQAEKPFFICTEDGVNELMVRQTPLCETNKKTDDWAWEDLFGWLRFLASKKGDQFKTVVIDTVDAAQNHAIEWIIEKEFADNGKDFDDFGKGYKVLMREWRKLLSALDFLNKSKGMEVILLSHATKETYTNPLGADYDVFKARLVDSPKTSIWGLTKGWSDLTLFMNTKIMVKTDSQKAKKGKAKMAAKRSIYSKPNAAYEAKVRVGWDLPDEFELDYQIFKAHLSNKKPPVQG